MPDSMSPIFSWSRAQQLDQGIGFVLGDRVFQQHRFLQRAALRADLDIEYVGADAHNRRRPAWLRCIGCGHGRRRFGVGVIDLRQVIGHGRHGDRCDSVVLCSLALLAIDRRRRGAVVLHPRLVRHPGQQPEKGPYQQSLVVHRLAILRCRFRVAAIAASVFRGSRTAADCWRCRPAGRLITTMSRPARDAWCSRNDSLITRLIRFRAVARRQFFFEIASPSLASRSSLCLHKTVNNVSRLARGPCKHPVERCRIEEPVGLFRTACCGRWSSLGVIAVVIVTGRFRGLTALRRQPCAAFCAATLEHEPPGFGGHAGTKSVGACALDFAGLKCAFHGRLPGSYGGTVTRRAFRRAARVRRWPDSVNRAVRRSARFQTLVSCG